MLKLITKLTNFCTFRPKASLLKLNINSYLTSIVLNPNFLPYFICELLVDICELSKTHDRNKANVGNMSITHCNNLKGLALF